MKYMVLKLLVLLVTFWLSEAFAQADAIKLHRGFPTDIWVNWLANDEFVNETNIKTFPEYRQSLNASHFKKMKDAGFDFVRLTLDPAIYLIKPSAEKTAKLNAGVLAAIAEIRGVGLNVDVDIHAIPVSGRSVGTESYLKDDASFAEYLNLVRDIAKMIADQDPAHVAFEPMNEPTIDCEWEKASKAKPRWPAMAKKMHDVARAAAPKLTIVLSGACWGGADSLAVLKPSEFKDENIIWSFHNYEPMYFTHQGASWAYDALPYFDGLSFPPDSKNRAKFTKATLARIEASDKTKDEKTKLVIEAKAAIDQYFKKGWAMDQLRLAPDMAAQWQAENGVPSARIIVGEFGVMKQDQTSVVPDVTRAKYMEQSRKIYESHGWAWSAWSWGGSMGITDSDADRNPTPAIMKALGMKVPSLF